MIHWCKASIALAQFVVLRLHTYVATYVQLFTHEAVICMLILLVQFIVSSLIRKNDCQMNS